VKVWKILSGIISCMVAIVAAIQAFTMDIIHILSEYADPCGIFGIILAVLLLAGGIISITTCKAEGSGGNVALILIFTTAFVIGLFKMTDYPDLIIWAWWGFVCVIVATANQTYRSRYEKAFIESVVETGEIQKRLPGADVERWYYQVGQQWYGPITRSDIPKIEAMGYLKPNTPVFYEGAQQASYMKDSAIRGFIRAYHAPDTSRPGIVLPTVFSPLILLILGCVATWVFSTGVLTQTVTTAAGVPAAPGSSIGEMEERLADANGRVEVLEEGYYRIKDAEVETE